MLTKLNLLAVAAVANAGVLDARGATTSACPTYKSCMLNYMGGGGTKASYSAAHYCSSFLSIQTSTSTVSTTVTPPTVTSTVTSAKTAITSVSCTVTSTSTATVTPPTTTITSTSTCDPSTISSSTATVTATAVKRNPSTCTQQACTATNPAGATCSAPGFLTAPSLLAITEDKTFAACRDSCKSNSKCKSFSFFQPWGPCQLYASSISSQKLWQPSGCQNAPLIHYDSNCFNCKPVATPTPYPTPTGKNPYPTSVISSACSCLGVTTPVVTTTTTLTANTPTTTVTSTVSFLSTTCTSTATSTSSVTSTAATPTATASVTVPNTFTGTYTNQYGDTYAEFPYTDYVGGDLMSGTCYDQGQGFNVNGTLVPCADFKGCQDVCSYVNRNGYTCQGVSYHPNPVPHGYSTCYLKSQLPNRPGYCGEVGGQEEVDSAQLLSMGS